MVQRASVLVNENVNWNAASGNFAEVQMIEDRNYEEAQRMQIGCGWDGVHVRDHAW
jgi:hypothetical protein